MKPDQRDYVARALMLARQYEAAKALWYANALLVPRDVDDALRQSEEEAYDAFAEHVLGGAQ